jgi:uncharacterized protein YkwD
LKYFLVFNIVMTSVPNSLAQEWSADERRLYNEIMDYRKSKNLPSIPLSKSLTYVAQMHSRDLAQNNPNQGKCNLHSWSKKGKWKSCCYTSDHAKAQCMWDKPKEMTGYVYPGYEISCVGASTLFPKEALDIWISSPPHHEVIINKGIWNDPWKAIGIGMHEGYATVWFGHYPEPN